MSNSGTLYFSKILNLRYKFEVRRLCCCETFPEVHNHVGYMRISRPFMLEIAGNADFPSLEILDHSLCSTGRLSVHCRVNEEETTKFGTTQISYD